VSGSYTGITGTGALNAGSVTSGFGNINIGTSTFTGNGSGLTTLNATNLTSGTVDSARLPLLVRKSFRTSTLATETLNFATGDEVVRSTRAGALTFAGSNYTAGVSKTVVWNGGGTTRTVSFPSGWVFVSVKPTSLAANKRGVLSVVAHGTAEGDVTAAWAAEA
jgi:hypothetical protein